MAKKTKEVGEKVSPEVGKTYPPKHTKHGKVHELDLAEKIGTEEK